ncbi:MAG: hypothetical protein Q8N76_01600 [Candidatus Omnitrophota bacterium]|nr:hypothetical protein [Candidatus Omnitrophota bacterium]
MNKNILGHNGEPVKEQHKINLILNWIGKNWKAWLPITVSIFALGVSVAGYFIADRANKIASKNYDITQKLSKLDFRPIIRLDTLFRSAGKVPPNFGLTNIGSVEAQQIKVSMIIHRYFPEAEKIRVVVTGTENDVIIPKLVPQERRAFKFQDIWLNTNARMETPPENNIMEIRITYCRPQDLKKFDESAFYFINPEGLWVSEGESSLKLEKYQKMKSALLSLKASKNIKSIYEEWKGDELHPND